MWISEDLQISSQLKAIEINGKGFHEIIHLKDFIIWIENNHLKLFLIGR